MKVDAVSFERSDDDRLVAGVAAGFARAFGVDVAVVRGALVVLSFAAGLGLVLYAVGALLSKPAGAASTVTPVDARRDVSVLLVAAGLLLVVRSTGLWLGDVVMVPVVVLVAGVCVLAMASTEDGSPSRLSALMSGRHAKARIGVGAALLVVGLVVVGTADRVSGTVRVGAFAAALSIVGVVLLVGPWIARLAQAAGEERRQRIRVEEREAMAAHLHDSVLQTLALIQRTADDPRRTATLARQQEHELREWLYGSDTVVADSLVGALQVMAAEVEVRHEVRIEVVAVGDTVLDDELQALVAATREACVNAAKHSGERTVSLYAEVGDDAVEVFVRDRGRGFDASAADGDRMGIAQSMIGRLERVGGSVRIESALGAGTEVQLRVQRPAHPGRDGRVAP